MNVLIQLLGAFLLLAAYGAVQLKYLRPNGKTYLLLNILGSCILAVDALRFQQWGFFVLEFSWMGISFFGLIKSKSVK
ncbi:MAG: hypothetical protein H7A32_02215 [Deltaproteobacteria bacterium]|nr:hypothetical protein [Deltaproteobacteria bacterium]